MKALAFPAKKEETVGFSPRSLHIESFKIMLENNRLHIIGTLLFVGITIVLLAYVFVFGSFESPAKTAQVQTKKAGNVEIIVTPEITSEETRFAVSLETHSVELSYLLENITTLTTDKGVVLKPLRWEGSAPGGHHREGTLIFSKLPGKTKSIDLDMRGIDNQDARFHW